MVPLQQGCIVWVEIPDSAGGNPKCRPAVVLTPTSEIADAPLIVVAAATSRIEQPLPENHIRLPWMHRKHPVTGLNKPCVVVCDWLAKITVMQIQEVGGVVPPHVLKLILKLAAQDPAKHSDDI